MSPAEFKTRRQGLWLSDNDLATRLGVADARTIRYWEAGRNDIPTKAVQELIAIENAVNVMVDRALSMPGVPKQIALVRYRSDQDMPANIVKVLGPPAHKLHANALHRIMNILVKRGIEVGVVYFDPEKYRLWLDGREDRPNLRAEWAAQELK